MAIIVGLSSCELMDPFGNMGDAEEKQKVIGEWEFEKIEYEEGVETPTEMQKGDKMTLRADDTFTCVEGGAEISGNWDFLSHRRGNVISLMEDGDWECIEYRVESVTETELVYSFKQDNHCSPTYHSNHGFFKSRSNYSGIVGYKS